MFSVIIFLNFVFGVLFIDIVRVFVLFLVVLFIICMMVYCFVVGKVKVGLGFDEIGGIVLVVVYVKFVVFVDVVLFSVSVNGVYFFVCLVENLVVGVVMIVIF